MVDAGAFAILAVARLEASNAEAAIRALAQALAKEGHVKGTFEAAALGRERKSPTGLPFAGSAVALPHAEPEHVNAPAIAIASLARPVKFRQMGSPAMPLIITLLGLALGQGFAKSFRAGLTVGVGFIAIGLVVGLLVGVVGPKAMAFADVLGLKLDILDVGWPMGAAVSFASPIAAALI